MELQVIRTLSLSCSLLLSSLLQKLSLLLLFLSDHLFLAYLHRHMYELEISVKKRIAGEVHVVFYRVSHCLVEKCIKVI